MESDVSRDLRELGAAISGSLGSRVESVQLSRGELVCSASAGEIVHVLRFLRDDPRCGFVSFIDLCGVDYPARARRFEVVYHLLAPRQNRRIRVKIQASEGVPVPSVISVFPAANWFEREVYDLYGVLFSGHPDLRRILTDYGFDGHPLRKDFPVTGFVEVRYDHESKRVVHERVSLPQAFRGFDFASPWKGYDASVESESKSGRSP